MKGNKAMSNETTKTRASRSSAAPKEEAEVKSAPIVAKDIDLNQLIVVRNGYQGRLVYKSNRTHEKFVWPEFGSEQMIELKELRNAKNTFKNNISSSHVNHCFRVGIVILATIS